MNVKPIGPNPFPSKFKLKQTPPFRGTNCQPIKPEITTVKKKENGGKPILTGFVTGVLLTLGILWCRPR